jgi:UrcA family protein
MNKWIVIACMLSGIGSTHAQAAPTKSETSEIKLRYDRRELSSPAGARHLLKRIGNAALEVCGGSSFSMNEFKTATVQSQCWRDAVDAAVRRVDDPLLTAAHAQSEGRLRTLLSRKP